jgi:hypothetical protein
MDEAGSVYLSLKLAAQLFSASRSDRWRPDELRGYTVAATSSGDRTLILGHPKRPA